MPLRLIFRKVLRKALSLRPLGGGAKARNGPGTAEPCPVLRGAAASMTKSMSPRLVWGVWLA